MPYDEYGEWYDEDPVSLPPSGLEGSGEMSPEELAAMLGPSAMSGLNLDTPPPLQPTSTGLDWMSEDPDSWLAPSSPQPFDVASSYYDDWTLPGNGPAETAPITLDTSLSSAPKPVKPGGSIDPETGIWSSEEKAPWYKRVGGVLNDIFNPAPQIDTKTGKPVQTSPSSSLPGIAAGAARGASDSRLEEAKLALARDQTNANLYSTQQSATLRASEIDMMRKRLLNAQRSKALYMLSSPTASAAQKAAAQAALAKIDQEFAPTAQLLVPKPGTTPMPERPWWETALAAAGLAGMGGQAVANSTKSNW